MRHFLIQKIIKYAYDITQKCYFLSICQYFVNWIWPKKCIICSQISDIGNLCPNCWKKTCIISYLSCEKCGCLLEKSKFFEENKLKNKFYMELKRKNTEHVVHTQHDLNKKIIHSQNTSNNSEAMHKNDISHDYAKNSKIYIQKSTKYHLNQYINASSNDEYNSQQKCEYCNFEDPTYLDRNFSIFMYESLSRNIAFKIKNSQFYECIPLIEKMFQFLISQHAELVHADCIIPIPLHWSRLIIRGYNQAKFLSKLLSHVSKIKIKNCLYRHKKTASQGKLNITQRKENLNNAFEIKAYYKNFLQNKTIILVDDVMTTGATLNEAAKILKANGVKTVYSVTLCKTTEKAINLKYNQTVCMKNIEW